jgi:hypothetical protein
MCHRGQLWGKPEADLRIRPPCVKVEELARSNNIVRVRMPAAGARTFAVDRRSVASRPYLPMLCAAAPLRGQK